MPELTRRYVVMTMAVEAPFDPSDPDAVFVLKPWKDPAALHALGAYRDNCYPSLARDLDAWIGVIQAGPVVRGDIGRRNEAYAGSRARSSRSGTAKSRPRSARRAGPVTSRARTGKDARRSTPKRRKRSR